MVSRWTQCEETNVVKVDLLCGERRGLHTVLSRHEAFGLHKTVRRPMGLADRIQRAAAASSF